MWNKKWRRSSTALQNLTCGITLNICSIVCNCVSTQMGTILKVIVVDFQNLLNRKSYRHSLVFFVSDLVYWSWSSYVESYIPSYCLVRQEETVKITLVECVVVVVVVIIIIIIVLILITTTTTTTTRCCGSKVQSGALAPPWDFDI